jgi:bifunctional non-homologous end joining protein LigD
VQVLTRTGLDWTAKYPSAIAALANVNVKTAYLDGELSGVDDAGLPSFAQTQAATDGERGVHLVYCAFDLLHIGGWDVSISPNVASQGEMWTMLMQMIRQPMRSTKQNATRPGQWARAHS